MALKQRIKCYVSTDGISPKRIIVRLLSAVCLIFVIAALILKQAEHKSIDSFNWAQVQNWVDFSELYQNKIETLKAAYANLSTVDSYIECSSQFLDIPDSWFSSQFIYAYDIMSDSERAFYEDMNQAGVIYPVRTLQVSKNCMDFFEITADNGRLFTDEDMNHVNGASVPVLAGSSYSEFLDVGSTFRGSYILNDLEFTVVGILSADCNININGVPLYLNDYILMPSFNCVDAPQSEDDEIFQVRHYVNKLGGMYQRADGEEIGEILEKINTLGIGSFS